MHFHLPKPLHGWREFAGEVGIIVIGVLIALGAEQLVQNAHERTEARNADRAVRAELELNMGRLASRVGQKGCVEGRIAEIQSLLDVAAADGSIARPSWIGRPQFWTMQTVRWEAIAQGGRAALLPPDELADYGLLYNFMRNINGAMVSEQADWARLRTLEHMRRLTPQMIFELNASLQDARYFNWRIKRWILQMEPSELRLGLRPARNDLPATRSACVPMTTPREQALRESGGLENEP
jgi:hypothetical protein